MFNFRHIFTFLFGGLCISLYIYTAKVNILIITTKRNAYKNNHYMLYNINIMIMDRNEMLQDLIDSYAGGNKSKFASLIGVIPQVLTGWMNRGTMNKELIYQHLPRVSAHWLLTDGEGEMIVPEVKESPPTDDAKHLKKRIGELERDVNSKQSTIDALQAILADQRETINDLKKDLASSRARVV